VNELPAKLSEHLGYRLRVLSNRVSDSFARRMKKHGVSVPQWVILRILHDEKALPLMEIANRIGTDQGALSRMIDRLLARGLVKRDEDVTDRRRVAISITPAGSKLVPLLAKEADENDREFFKCLPSGQRQALEKAIDALLAMGPEGAGAIAIQ